VGRALAGGIRRRYGGHRVGGAALDGTTHPSAARAASSSEAVVAFRARKLIPWVPNFAALEDWGAPANTSARQGISNPTKPAAVTVA
jgi:hypothetical protein